MNTQRKFMFTRKNAVILLVMFVFLTNAAANPALRITIFDVGHGDAALIRTPCGNTVLIDSGEGHHGQNRYDGGRDTILPFLEKHGIQKLDWLILTHPHNDHIGGAIAILKKLPISRVALCGMAYPSRNQYALYKLLDDRKIPVLFPKRGEKLPLSPALTTTVLNPPEQGYHHTSSDANNNSLALAIQYQENRILFAGDCDQASLEDMRRAFPNLKSSIIKLPHHGSETGLHTGFWKQLAFHTAIISVHDKLKEKAGAYHGLPHQEVLDFLRNRQVRLLRTDYHGTISLYGNGKNWSIRTSVSNTRAEPE